MDQSKRGTFVVQSCELYGLFSNNIFGCWIKVQRAQIAAFQISARQPDACSCLQLSVCWIPASPSVVAIFIILQLQNKTSKCSASAQKVLSKCSASAGMAGIQHKGGQGRNTNCCALGFGLPERMDTTKQLPSCISLPCDENDWLPWLEWGKQWPDCLWGNLTFGKRNSPSICSYCIFRSNCKRVFLNQWKRKRFQWGRNNQHFCHVPTGHWTWEPHIWQASARVQFQLAGWWINAGPNLLGQVMLLTDGAFLDQMDYQELQTA